MDGSGVTAADAEQWPISSSGIETCDSSLGSTLLLRAKMLVPAAQSYRFGPKFPMHLFTLLSLDHYDQVEQCFERSTLCENVYY